MEERSIDPALGPALIDTAILTGATAALLSRLGTGDSGSSIAAYHEGNLIARSVADPAGGKVLSAELRGQRHQHLIERRRAMLDRAGEDRA